MRTACRSSLTVTNPPRWVLDQSASKNLASIPLGCFLIVWKVFGLCFSDICAGILAFSRGEALVKETKHWSTCQFHTKHQQYARAILPWWPAINATLAIKEFDAPPFLGLNGLCRAFARLDSSTLFVAFKSKPTADALAVLIDRSCFGSQPSESGLDHRMGARFCGASQQCAG